MGPVSCLIIQDDPPSSGGEEAKYTGGLNIESCDVPDSYSGLVTVHQFRADITWSGYFGFCQVPLMRMMNLTEVCE